MDNKKAIKALNQIKTYCAASLLDDLDYVIKVMEKLDEDGVSRPLEADFTKIKN